MPLVYNNYEFNQGVEINGIKELISDINLYNQAEVNKLSIILHRIKCDFTVISESPYVDRNFRDSYYIYHSRKFFLHNRDCIRLLLFEGKFDSDVLSPFSEKTEEQLNKKFICFIIIQPIYLGLIGTTVINPTYLDKCNGYMCVGEFKCTVLGYTLKANGFLYSSQNSETVTCAELTILGIVNTLAHISPNYKCIVPSDIIYSKVDYLHERVLPSKGLPYEMVSLLLNKYAGSSRLYFLGKEDLDKGDKSEILRKMFHTYVESGLPLAVAVKGTDENDSTVRHSIVCIGHGKRSYYFSNKAEPIGEFSVIDSYKLYDEYILIDDNQPPYITQKYDDFTIYKDSKVVGFVVPLPQSAFLEADEAYFIGIEALFNFTDTRIDEDLLKEKYKYDCNSNPLVTRLYLTSSAKYKKFKSKTLKSTTLIDFYLTLNLPHYIWVMEISTANLYSRDLAFGDVIIDATYSNTKNSINSVILVHYSDRLGCVDLVESSECINADINGKRKRWGSFNVYDNINEEFQLFSNNDSSLRSVN